MLTFLTHNWEFIVSAFFGILGFVAFCITLFRTGSIKKSINNFLEVDNLKFKTYNSAVAKKRHGQSFDEEIDDYILNTSSNELEKLPNKKNIQDIIQSYVDTCLERSLEKFLPNVISEDDDIVHDYDVHVSDLAVLADAMDAAETYREKLGLKPGSSLAEIYEAVDKEAVLLKQKLNEKKEKLKNEENAEK